MAHRYTPGGDASSGRASPMAARRSINPYAGLSSSMSDSSRGSSPAPSDGGGSGGGGGGGGIAFTIQNLAREYTFYERLHGDCIMLPSDSGVMSLSY